MAYDFPNTPTPGQAYSGYVYDGEKWQVQGTAMQNAVRYDVAQGLTANQTAQGRANIWVTKKNYIVNGGMMVSQENGVNVGTTNGYYPVDLFFIGLISTGTIGAVQAVSTTPAGSPNRLRVAAGTVDTSIAATEVLYVRQVIEGLRVADLRFGSAAAKTITIQFGVKAPAGTYCVGLLNAATNRSYVAEYVVAAGEANIDVVKSVTIAGDTTGTWLSDNGIGMFVTWCLMAGANFQQAAGSWGTAAAFASANQFNFMGQNAASFELFDVSLTEGSVAPPFQLPDYASELALCMRYYEKTGSDHHMFCGNVTSGNGYYKGTLFAVPKRAVPTLSGVSIGNLGFPATIGTLATATTTGFFENRTANALQNGAYYQSNITANARL